LHLLCWVFLSVNANAQKFYVRHYTEINGLGNSLVSGMAQDSSGVMWFSTRTGISSYDGLNWKTFTAKDGLYPGNYGFIFIDAKDIIWVLSPGDSPRLSFFNGQKWNRISKDTTGIVNDEYTSLMVIYKDDLPVVFIGTERHGLYIYNKNQWRVIGQKEGLASDQVNSLALFRDTVFIATNESLCFLAGDDGFTPGYPTYVMPDKNLLGISSGSVPGDSTKKCLWFCSKNHIGFVTGNAVKIIESDINLITDGKINNAFIRHDGNMGIYYGNAFYLYYIDLVKNKTTKLGIANGLISEGATDILIDREKVLWICGYRGVNKIASKRFRNFFKDHGLFDNEVTSIIETSPGNFVFGHHGGLTFFDGNSFKTLDIRKKKHYDIHEARVQDMDADTQGNLWVAASRLGILKISTRGVVKVFGQKENVRGNAVSILVLNDSTILASTDDGLCRLKNGRFELIGLGPDTPPSYRKIFKSNKGTVFLTTYNQGVYETDLKNTLHYMSKKDMLANNTYCFFEDSKGIKWIGSVNGLHVLLDTIIVKPEEPILHINRPVYHIFEDIVGRLWLGSDNGIYIWDGENLENLSVTDGLAGHETNRDAGYPDHNGDIWIGTNNGLTFYDRQSDFKPGSLPKPKTSLLYLVSENDTLRFDKEIELTYNQRNFSVHYRVASFINEEKTKVSYLLEGFNKDWSAPENLNSDEERYYNLPPGSYRFCIKAANANGVWGNKSCSPVISIAYPFWYKWWFILLAISAFIVFIYLIYRFVIITRYNLNLRKEVAIQTREIQRSRVDLLKSNKAKDSFFSIIAHDLKNPFNSILGLSDLLITDYHNLSEKEHLEILENLKSVSLRTVNLLDNLLTWARAQRGTIAFEPDVINIKVLVTENINLSKSFADSKRITLINLINDDTWVFADENMINTVIRNLLSNAIKFTFPGGRVVINSIVKENFAEICVADNGKGMTENEVENLFEISESFTTRGTANETGSGLGLILCREFVAKNGGGIKAQSTIDKGSKFCFTLPLPGRPETGNGRL